nr:MAG TPA: hypothetical protein [Caudoviricetes sp.]
MEDSKVLYYIDKGIERLQENSRFPPESIINNDRFLSAYAFTNNDYRLFQRWVTVIMEVKAIDTSKSFYIPCILRKVPEQIYNRRVNDICHGTSNQYTLNESYIEDLEIVLNEKYYKILAEKNFMKAVYCENGELKMRQSYSFDTNMSAAAMKLYPRKCNLAFYPYSFSMFAYTSDPNTWNTELFDIIGDRSFESITKLSKQYFTINDVSLGTFISKLTLNEGYSNGRCGIGYENIIMKCVCNSLSLVFYDKTTLSKEEIEKAAITINENDPNFNKSYTINDYSMNDKEIIEFSKLFDDGSNKSKDKPENKPNIIIANDEFLI